MPENGLDLIEKKDKKRLWKSDLLLILFFLLIAAVFLILYRVSFSSKTGESATVVVTVDGTRYGTYPLGQERQIRITGKDYENVLSIKDGKASMIKADCPDQICVHHVAIFREGETIVCLPHKIVVEIEGRETEDTTASYDILSR